MNSGKALLMVAGAGFGLIRSLRIPGGVHQNAAALKALSARVDTIHIAVSRLADQTGKLQARVAETVTRNEMTEALGRVFGQVERGVETRFEQQSRSVEALRAMVAETDELLERVLVGLDAMQERDDDEKDDGSEGAGREWNLSRAEC